MKIKNSFVTNSSSTGYIVSIPDRFNIKECVEYLDANHLFQNLDNLEDVDEEKDRFINYIISLFETLRDDDVIGTYDCDNGCENVAYYEIINIIQDNKLIICEVDLGPDEGYIENLNRKTLEDKLNQIEKQKFPYENNNEVN